ncbi:MAG: hypothetical protein H6659_03415 [Ardenticatenaceae bacterium]|nr:hypothetical protein [Ardenticatenaceae bacterium]
MIQPQTQNPDYWGSAFTLTESDVEQIYNHFLEVEKPQTVEQIARVIIAHRVAEEKTRIERLMTDRLVYQPKAGFAVGDELVFPVLKFAHGKVTGIRPGYNPSYGKFNVIAVEIKGKTREFASELPIDHDLNLDNGSITDAFDQVDVNELQTQYGETVADRVTAVLNERAEFVRLGIEWFVKALMVDVNVGHLHLSEAILEVNEGGPLRTDEILPHLDMDPAVDPATQAFSLNYALLNDKRFDEVAPKGQVLWFLKRLEPDGVKNVPERLINTAPSYDRAMLSPQLMLLERELDDEWSNIPAPPTAQPVVFTLMYPHRHAGTLPLSSRIRPLFPPSSSPHQRVVLIDDETDEEIVGWVVQEHRYVYGLGDWYEKNEIPIGGFVHLSPGPKPGVLLIGFDRRRAQREWVRLATAVDNRIKFELMRRAVGCGYDDLLIVGTDVVAAIDALWRRAEANDRSVASLLGEIFPELANLNPQNTVHAKTLYSAINMLRRLPPGPVFAELVRHPAFQPVGDHYWRFDSSRW